MRVFQRCLPVIIWALVTGNTIAAEAKNNKPMQGVPPTRDSQVTMKNYRDYPANRWAFRNAGAPLNVVMIPREGQIVPLPGPTAPQLGQFEITDLAGNQLEFDAAFESSYADGVAVVQGSTLLHETYFGDFSQHAQHIWFSMSKSLASAAFGLLVAEDRVDLQASPADYIPELAGSGFERRLGTQQTGLIVARINTQYHITSGNKPTHQKCLRGFNNAPGHLCLY